MPQPFPSDGGDSPADGRQRPSASVSVKGSQETMMVMVMD
jgi:hypothetical protein